MRLILALDTGGTKCQALLLTEGGNVVGAGYQEGLQIEGVMSKGGAGRDRRTITEAATQALGGASYDELIVANTKRMTLDLDERPVQFVYFDEMSSALALVGETSGVAVLAGTGALVAGITPDGRGTWLDGLGPMLGDYGSAYYIGHLAIRAASRSEWHPRHATSLGKAVRRVLGGIEDDPRGHSLVPFSLGNYDRADIAGLSKLVTAEAAAGDAVALGILQQAAVALSETVFDVVDRLKMADTDSVMVGTGGVLSNSPIYWDLLCAEVHKFAPRLRPVLSDLPPVVGIAMQALRATFPEDWRLRADHLCSSAREFYAGLRVTQTA